MISHEHRAIFIHIQKTGGTSVSFALGGGRKDPCKHWGAGDLREIIDVEHWEGYYKFAFVRNPWARLVSWWSMIDAQRALFEAGKSTNALVLKALSRCQTFADFLERMDDDVENHESARRVNIWMNQTEYLTRPDGALLVDFVGRTETLDRDIEQVRPHLAAPLGLIARENTSKHGHYTDYYTASQRDLVAERYARDLEQFGYQFGEEHGA